MSPSDPVLSPAAHAGNRFVSDAVPRLDRADRLWAVAFWILAIASLGLMSVLSFDYGITWDEPIQDAYGQLIYSYYRSGLTDRSALHFGISIFYGGFFEVLCAV